MVFSLELHRRLIQPPQERTLEMEHRFRTGRVGAPFGLRVACGANISAIIERVISVAGSGRFNSTAALPPCTCLFGRTRGQEKNPQNPIDVQSALPAEFVAAPDKREGHFLSARHQGRAGEGKGSRRKL